MLCARRARGIPFTWLTVGGVALGVAILVITLSIIDGFAASYRDGLVRFHAPVLIVREDEQIDRSLVESALAAHAAETTRASSAQSIRWINRARDLWWWGTWKYSEWTWGVRNIPALAAWVDLGNPRQLVALLPLPARFVAWREHWHATLRGQFEHGVTGYGPFLYREALLIGNGAIRGVALRGMRPEQITQLQTLQVTLTAPQTTVAAALQVPDGPIPILLGSAVAAQVGTRDVSVFVPNAAAGKTPTAPKPTLVVGTFTSGIYEFDSQFAFVDLARLQTLYGLGSNVVTGYEVQIEHLDTAAWIADALREALGPEYTLQDWRELHRETFEAVAVEKILFGLIMGILVIIAAANIVTAMLLRILLQYRSVAVLHAIGLSSRATRRLYYWQGVALGTVGVGVGIGLGCVIAWALGTFQWITIAPEIYFLSHIPVHISVWTVGGITLFALTTITLAASRAARRVADLPILQALGRGYV